MTDRDLQTAQLLCDFEAHLREAGKSPQTVNCYLHDTREFAAWLRKQKPPRFLGQPESVAHLLARRYLGDVTRRGFGNAVVRRRITSLRALWKWLLQTGRAKRNPLLAIEPPRVQRAPSPALSVEEVAHLLNVPGERLLDVRDRALLELLYATGAPLKEVAAMTLGDVESRLLEIMLGRGTCVERRVPLGRAAQKVLRAYLEVRSQFINENRATEHLWLCGRGVPMSEARIYQTVRARGRDAGMENRASPSALRRACAIHLLQAGAPPGDVTTLLGFTSVTALARMAKE